MADGSTQLCTCTGRPGTSCVYHPDAIVWYDTCEAILEREAWRGLWTRLKKFMGIEGLCEHPREMWQYLNVYKTPELKGGYWVGRRCLRCYAFTVNKVIPTIGGLPSVPVRQERQRRTRR